MSKSHQRSTLVLLVLLFSLTVTQSIKSNTCIKPETKLNLLSDVSGSYPKIFSGINYTEFKFNFQFQVYNPNLQSIVVSLGYVSIHAYTLSYNISDQDDFSIIDHAPVLAAALSYWTFPPGITQANDSVSLFINNSNSSNVLALPDGDYIVASYYTGSFGRSYNISLNVQNGIQTINAFETGWDLAHGGLTTNFNGTTDITQPSECTETYNSKVSQTQSISTTEGAVVIAFVTIFSLIRLKLRKK